MIAAAGLCAGLFGGLWWKRSFPVPLGRRIRFGRRLSSRRRFSGDAVVRDMPVALDMVKRIRRVLSREILRERLLDLIRAEQLLGHFEGSSASRIAEVNRLVDVLAWDEDDVAAAGMPVARLQPEEACVAAELHMAGTAPGDLADQSRERA